MIKYEELKDICNGLGDYESGYGSYKDKNVHVVVTPTFARVYIRTGIFSKFLVYDISFIGHFDKYKKGQWETYIIHLVNSAKHLILAKRMVLFENLYKLNDEYSPI